MRLHATAVLLFCISTGASPQPPQTNKLTQIPEGVLSGNVYTNDNLQINFRLPQGWDAKVNPQMPAIFNPSPDALANRCTRILLEFDSVPSDSKAKGVLFAIDPDCLGVGPFPAVDAGKDELEAFNRSIFEIYWKSTFFPPSGVKLYAYKGAGDQSRLFLGMAGVVEVPEPDSDQAYKRESVSMNTLFVLVDVDKYWVGWAIVADDKAKDEFAKDSRMTVK